MFTNIEVCVCKFNNLEVKRKVFYYLFLFLRTKFSTDLVEMFVLLIDLVTEWVRTQEVLSLHEKVYFPLDKSFLH